MNVRIERRDLPTSSEVAHEYQQFCPQERHLFMEKKKMIL